jgi:hypothetical protein
MRRSLSVCVFELLFMSFCFCSVSLFFIFCSSSSLFVLFVLVLLLGVGGSPCSILIESSMSGLLIAAKSIPPTEVDSLLQIQAALGSSFLIRLLQSPNYLAAAAPLISSLCMTPQVASQPNLQKLAPALLQALLSLLASSDTQQLGGVFEELQQALLSVLQGQEGRLRGLPFCLAYVSL